MLYKIGRPVSNGTTIVHQPVMDGKLFFYRKWAFQKDWVRIGSAREFTGVAIQQYKPTGKKCFLQYAIVVFFYGTNFSLDTVITTVASLRLLKMVCCRADKIFSPGYYFYVRIEGC